MIDLGVYDAMRTQVEVKSEEEEREWWARVWAKHKKRTEEYLKELTKGEE